MGIRLIENTGYHYDSVYRFYGWEHAHEILPVTDCGAETIGEFYLAAQQAWSRETCSPQFRAVWHKENPSIGQCTITAYLVHEYFGGEILLLPLSDSGFHAFNRIGGEIIDLACEQFGKNALPDFSCMQIGSVEELLNLPDKKERCGLLRERLLRFLNP